MAPKLTFSVGIPAYNQGEFLEATIESLLHQTRPPDQIFISDHFSTDSTPDIVRRYVRQGKVEAGSPPPGSNVGAQWVYTLSRLTGDWVTLFSSDDIAYPNFCEALMRGATRRPDAVLVRAGWENIDLAGKVLSKQYLLSVKAATLPPATLFEQRHGPKASFAAFAVHRETLIRSGGYPVAMESFGDWPMFMQLAPFGSFLYESELISGYRLHQSDKFRQRLGMWLRDEQRMFSEVMPKAAAQAGLTDLAWIAEASAANFKRYLASAAEKLTLAERLQHVFDFAPWAASVGCTPLLERFAAGDPVASPVSLLDRTKALVRPLAQRVYGSLQRG